MVWVPRARVVVLKLATPPTMEAEPIGVVPSRNVTDPVGAFAACVLGATVARKVMLSPVKAGLLSDAIIAVVVGSTAWLIASVSAPRARTVSHRRYFPILIGFGFGCAAGPELLEVPSPSSP